MAKKIARMGAPREASIDDLLSAGYRYQPLEDVQATPPASEGTGPMRRIADFGLSGADLDERFAAYQAAHPALAAEFTRRMSGRLPAGWATPRG